MRLPTKCNGQSFTVCVCEFGANDSVAWPLCGGNQEPGGTESGQAERWPGWGRGEARTVALWVWMRGCGPEEEVEQQRRAGVAQLSHCSQHLLLGQ